MKKFCRRPGPFLAALILSMAALASVSCRRTDSTAHQASWIELTLQSRDPKSGEIILTKQKVDPATVGIVVVDMWNFHWCKTASERVGAMVPRMEAVLERAHHLGMTLFWCPSDVADNYAGTIQYQAAAAVRPHPLPPLAKVSCPSAPGGAGGCMCGGPTSCSGNYGWDAMHDGLVMHPDDFMPNDMETLYSLCVERKIKYLIYMGVHTQICLLGKSIGLLNMKEAGFQCILARDLTDAFGGYDPQKGFTPDLFTAKVVAHFEQYLAPSINFADELKKTGPWDASLLVDPVRVAPWGTASRPHFFEKPFTVTLSAPWEPTAVIYYTFNDWLPRHSWKRYTGPFEVSNTCALKASANVGDREVCLESEADFVRLPPRPPMPDLLLSDLTPLRAVGPGHSPSSSSHRFSPGVEPPQRDRSNRDTPLRVHGRTYEKGMGVHAPDLLVYELKPEYDRFVGLAGDDEQILAVSSGSNLAMHPNVIFKVFIDGKLMAQSPTMRISEGPWRFDVKIPPRSQRISLVADDAGAGNAEDLADWVNAGFVVKK